MAKKTKKSPAGKKKDAEPASVSKELVLQALERVKGPDLDDNIIALELVSEIVIHGTMPPQRHRAHVWKAQGFPRKMQYVFPPQFGCQIVHNGTHRGGVASHSMTGKPASITNWKTYLLINALPNFPRSRS